MARTKFNVDKDKDKRTFAGIVFDSQLVVSKTMTVRMDESETFYNILFVSLQPDDTVDLFGKFVYQITIKDIDNNVDIPQQGVIYIHNNINKEFVRR